VTITQKPVITFCNPGAASVTFHCEHDQSTHYFIFWYKQSQGGELFLITYSSGTGTADTEPAFNKSKFTMARPQIKKSSLEIKNLESSDTAVYFCASRRSLHCANYEAYFGQGTKLTVLDPSVPVTSPKNLKILKPSKEEIKKKKKATLVCVATGFYPDHITVSWKVNGQDQTKGVKTDDAAIKGNDKKYSITSRLRVRETEWFNPKKKFTCITSFYNGSAYMKNEVQINGELDVNSTGCGLTADAYMGSTKNVSTYYVIFLGKSVMYGLFVTVLAWKIKRNSGKHYN
uniref:Ig-like domain-containing protein n=1 Tax=Lepisosteus oculatus TaxID=7918 RepID=W5N795_LEPOC